MYVTVWLDDVEQDILAYATGQHIADNDDAAAAIVALIDASVC